MFHKMDNSPVGCAFYETATPPVPRRYLTSELGRAYCEGMTNLTNDTAAALVASMPKPPGLTLAVEGDAIVMDGGKFGGHSLSVKVSSAARVWAHWQGYCEVNGHKVHSDGLTVTAQAKPAPLAAVTWADALKPGDVVDFPSPSAHSGRRRGRVLRVTASRVLVGYWCKVDLGRNGRREGDPPRQKWCKKSEINK